MAFVWVAETDRENLKASNLKSDEMTLVFDGNAPVEYYNLQGMKVATPSNGIFIKIQGSKVSKVYVK